jgi:hypothetical protein
MKLSASPQTCQTKSFKRCEGSAKEKRAVKRKYNKRQSFSDQPEGENQLTNLILSKNVNV